LGGFLESFPGARYAQDIDPWAVFPGAASVVVAAQRGAVAPSMGHAMAPAPAVGAHAASPMHGAPPAAHGAPVHAGTHGAPGARAVTTSHKAMPGEPVTPQPRNTNGHPFYPYPTNLLPGVSDNFVGGYPVPGLGFDYARLFCGSSQLGPLASRRWRTAFVGRLRRLLHGRSVLHGIDTRRGGGRAGRCESAAGSLPAGGCRGAT